MGERKEGRKLGKMVGKKVGQKVGKVGVGSKKGRSDGREGGREGGREETDLCKVVDPASLGLFTVGVRDEVVLPGHQLKPKPSQKESQVSAESQ